MTDPLPELAAPPTGPLEVSFRRLLAKCEARVAEEKKAQPASKAWRTDPVFHHYVETLEEQLSDLGASESAGLPESVLRDYDAHVSALAKALRPPDLPAFCRPASKVERFSGRAVAVAPACGRSAEIKSLAESASRERPSSSTAADGKDTRRASRLEMHRNLQEDLSEDLASLAKGLKGNALAMDEALQRRAKILETADAGLARSMTTMTKNATLAGKVEVSSRSMTCYTLLVLFWVMVAFMGVAVFIKMTSVAGYRAAPPPSAHSEL